MKVVQVDDLPRKHAEPVLREPDHPEFSPSGYYHSDFVFKTYTRYSKREVNAVALCCFVVSALYSLFLLRKLMAARGSRTAPD